METGKQQVQRLYPPPVESLPLAGLYLAHDLNRLATAGRPFVYTNFISSLDGRISQPDPGSGLRRVPPVIANPRDWRLYMELAAQADVLVTSARHLRAVARGRHGELIDIGTGEYADLGRWRTQRGLPARPAVAVVSERLDLPLEAVRERFDGRLLVLTSDAADPVRRRLSATDTELLLAGAGPGLTGDQIIDALARSGLPCIYSIAGPRVFGTLLRAGAPQRLYLTVANTLLGGEQFDTLVAGESLAPPAGYRLSELYLDAAEPPPGGQLFACFDREEAKSPL